MINQTNNVSHGYKQPLSVECLLIVYQKSSARTDQLCLYYTQSLWMSGPLGRYFCHYQSGLQVLLSDRVEEGSNWKLSFFSKNEKPAHSDHSCMQHTVNCLWLHRLSYHCTRFHPKDTKCKIHSRCPGNEDLSNSRNLPLTVNPGTCIYN